MVCLQIFLTFIFFTNLIYSAPPKNESDICTLRDYVPFIAALKDKRQLAKFAQSAHVFADAIGLRQATRKTHFKFKIVPPFSILPTKFPRELFDQAMLVQPAMNLLYFRVASDLEFLQNTLGVLAKSDDRVKNMLQIMHDVKQEGGYERQPISINWMRSDYMLNIKDNDKIEEKEVADDGQQSDYDEQHYELKQIEVNAGAAGGAMYAQRVTRVHRHILPQFGLDSSLAMLPDNSPYTLSIEAVYLAWLHFGNPDAVVLAIGHHRSAAHDKRGVEDVQRGLERISGGQLQYLEVGLEESDDRLILDLNNFSLNLDDGRQVAVVYYRIAPLPLRCCDEKRCDHKVDKMWRTVRTIERSTAIKMPTIGLHLANFKKVQQVLAKPGMVERFFPDPGEAHLIDAIRKTFTGLWELNGDDEKTEEIIQEAIAHPDRYVLKPMQEGGCNNFYGQDLADKLQSMEPEERATHILQQRLQPPILQNYVVEQFNEHILLIPKLVHMVTELGIFGILIGNVQDGTVLYNRGHGYLMRSKPANSNDGGVLTGVGFYDSPYLY